MRYDTNNEASENSLETFTKESEGPWKEDVLDLKPCWTKPVLGLCFMFFYLHFSIMFILGGLPD